MRFLYFYLMKGAPDHVRVAAPKHAAYWRELKLDGYLGGPFADRSGGLITFETDSAAEAEVLVANDPFVRGACSSAIGSRSGCSTEPRAKP